MFGKQIKIMSLYGFEVKINSSWIFLLLFLLWTLSIGYFPSKIFGLSFSMYLFMGFLGALGLFISLILHELAHSVVARKMGLSIKGITLFIFGGVAEMEDEPETAKVEFWMAIAGPVVSIVLGGLFFLLTDVGTNQQWPPFVLIVIHYLAQINLILAVFNLLPGFPLDGGRILRSVLWAYKKDLNWATHWAVKTGSFVGTLLMLLGLLAFFSGVIVAGIWWFVIAIFLKASGKASEYQIHLRHYLKNEPIHHFISANSTVIESNLNIRNVIDNYFYKYHHHSFPVSDKGHLVGVVTVDDLKKVPKEDREKTSLKEIYTESADENTVDANTDSYKVFQKMKNEGRQFLLIKDIDVLGIVTLNDLVEYLAIKIDLEENLVSKAFQFNM